MGDPWLFVLLAFAVYRFTSFMVVDGWPPIEAFRRWAIDKIGPRSPWVDLVTCPRCQGTYYSAIAVGLARVLGHLDIGWFMLLVWWWAVMGAQVILSCLDKELSD